MALETFAASTQLDNTSNKIQWKVRFVSLPHSLFTHPCFRDLSGGATKLLLAVLAGYVGSNNGHLTATFSRMKSFGFNSKESLARALKELIGRGLLVRTRSQHLRSPALYAVSWLPISPPEPGRPYDAGIAPTREALDLWRRACLEYKAGAA